MTDLQTSPTDGATDFVEIHYACCREDSPVPICGAPLKRNAFVPDSDEVTCAVCVDLHDELWPCFTAGCILDRMKR